ncbi:hypothetical protein BpHYR1_008631 [Brachionus plicatilis]|uniref:Uncharacterized protein n=1 Tax=Brachionus plicatilis TaxID=10195 RepID=A0A3M7RYS6_BRAPC|nr:hypothetical protein BpHYR1_008631 [Brachionus plicatilis]
MLHFLRVFVIIISMTIVYNLSKKLILLLIIKFESKFTSIFSFICETIFFGIGVTMLHKICCTLLRYNNDVIEVERLEREGCIRFESINDWFSILMVSTAEF